MASGDTLLVFTPLQATPPSASFATLDQRNLHYVLDHDATTSEWEFYEAVLPANYAGGGISVDVYSAATSATSGDFVIGVSVERLAAGGQDLDSDGFASEKTATSTTSGTSGVLTKTTVSFTSGAEMDSLAAGEPFRLQVARKPADAGDTMTGDLEIARVVVRET